MDKPLVIAHRGASAYAPENTTASFKKALEMGANGIELDVHISKDDHLIVMHDERVDRTTNGTGFIKDLTLSELKNLDAGSWFDNAYIGEQIPTLEEVLDLIKDKNLFLNIELKSGPILYEGIERRVIDLITKYNMKENVIISSFNHYSLLTVKEIDPSVKTGVLYMAGLVKPWEYAKKLNADAIHPLFYNIVPLVVIGCSNNKIQINPFTVNEEAHILGVAKAGVSGIITNYPDRARRIIDALNYA